MIDPGNIARRGYLETVLAISVDGYLGSLDEGGEDIATFIGTFGNTFFDTFGDTFGGGEKFLHGNLYIGNSAEEILHRSST